jgi:protein ImuB
MFACVYLPQPADDARGALTRLAQEFSPRYELLRDDLVAIDVRGLERLLGAPSAIGAELARDAGVRGLRVHVALAPAYTAATVLALSRPGVTVVAAATQAAALAPLPIGILERIEEHVHHVPAERASAQASHANGARRRSGARESVWGSPRGEAPRIIMVKRWGVRTLGELAALPAADLTARLGRGAAAWQAIARGDDLRPLVPALPEERFDATLELEWPIEGLEPLSFVLTRLLEPLSTRLERRDRGVAVLHVVLRLGPPAARGDTYARRLELPTPMRDVRTLRTLALLDLESHPPPAPIECVTVAIDPTPGRVLQHTLFTRAHPTPEQLSTLLARLGALMGQDRIGAATTVDSYRPGVFAMKPFATDHPPSRDGHASRFGETRPSSASSLQPPAARAGLHSALRRCRQPVPARVVAEHDRPVRVTTDRRGYAGGSVVHAAGPWRTSGEWWAGRARQAGEAGQAGRAGLSAWNRDEWDVSLSDGGVYRIFRDRDADAWFIDGIFD